MVLWSLLLLGSSICLADSLVRVSLVNTTFNEGRDLVNSGALGQFVLVATNMSKISITSRHAQNSSLFDSVGGVFTAGHSQFEDLANRFGHFCGGQVTLESLTFTRCIRPVTAAEYSCGGGSERGRRYTFRESLVVRGCGFVDSDSKDEKEGGAIRVEALQGSLTITSDAGQNSYFHNCRANNGWGAAVYAMVDSFQCDSFTCESITADYSVFHLQRGSTGVGTFSAATMSHAKFTGITITNNNNALSETQGGGSGLVIRYISSFSLSDCTFDNCQFTNKLNDKRAGALMFERVPSTAEITLLSLKKCTFTNTKGNTGCIYVSNPVKTFTVDEVTINGCGGSAESHPYSLYVNSQAVSLTVLKMQNMPGCYGQIWLGNVGGSVKFDRCEFSNFNTTFMFFRASTGSLDLTMSGCKFSGIGSPGENLFRVQAGNLSSLTISGCKFDKIWSVWALVLGTTSTCVINSDTTFTGVTITSEPVFCFKEGSVSKIEFDHVSFASSNLVFGILDIKSNAGSPSVSVRTVSCTSVSTSGNNPLPVFAISYGNIAVFDGCKFTQCTSTSSAIVQLGPAPNGGIKNCVFDRCSTSTGTPILKVKFGGVSLTSCEFKSMPNLKGAPVNIEATGSVTISGSVTFSSVTTEPSHPLIQVNQGVSLNLDGITISDCHFSKLISRQVNDATVSGTFSNNQVENLLDVSNSLTLGNSEFRSNTVRDGALIKVMSSLTIEGCCFQGTSGYDIQGTQANVNVVAHYPLCFDREQTQSVSFEGLSDPFSELTSEYKIFGCTTCGSPATVEPTPYPESDDETSFVDETTLIDESSFIDDTSVIDESSFIDDTSVIDESSLIDDTSVIDESSLIDDTSVIDETSSIDDTSDIDTLSPTTSDGESAKRGGLGGGVIAGIVIAILILVAVVVVLLWLFLGRKKDEKTNASSDREMNEETAVDTTTSFASVDEWTGKTTEDNPLFTEGEGPTMDVCIFEENWV